MCVAGQKDPAPQILKSGMLHDTFHQPLAQSKPAMPFEHEDIAQISHGCEVADHAGKTYLRATAIINAEAQRVLNGARYSFPGNVFGPITIGQKTVNHIQTQTLTVGADQKLA